MAGKKFKELKNALILVSVLVIFSVGIDVVFKNQDVKITGYATATNPEQSSTPSVSSASSPGTDVSVWQCQYYKETEFQKGTFEFNFIVYDARGGGRAIQTQPL